jgi:hypothetical protein
MLLHSLNVVKNYVDFPVTGTTDDNSCPFQLFLQAAAFPGLLT